MNAPSDTAAPAAPQAIGTPPFARERMRASLGEFLELHARRPIRDNRGGMRAPHLFATWFMVRALAPSAIVESGVFRGLGTWLLEQAAPAARLVCIDPDPSQIEYRSPRAEYVTDDFTKVAWDLPREETLLFFDDHQDEIARVQAAERFGFRHLMFEDNYPPGRGDCYSLKQALMRVPPRWPEGVLPRLGEALRRAVGSKADPGAYLERVLETYYEFPPVVRADTTRWGDAWDLGRYPTPEPLLSEPPTGAEAVFADEAAWYTWICYARLRRA